MYRKQRMQRIGIVLLFLGTGALGVMVGLYLFMTNPQLIPLAPTEEAVAQPVSRSATPEPDWKVTFEYRFATTGWESGPHSYQLQVSCPGSSPGSWSRSMNVRESAELRLQRVYLRTRGVYDRATGGQPLNAVHPNQSVGASLTLSYPTLDQAEAARANCESLVRLERGPWQRMEPRIPIRSE